MLVLKLESPKLCFLGIWSRLPNNPEAPTGFRDWGWIGYQSSYEVTELKSSAQEAERRWLALRDQSRRGAAFFKWADYFTECALALFKVWNKDAYLNLNRNLIKVKESPRENAANLFIAATAGGQFIHSRFMADSDIRILCMGSNAIANFDAPELHVSGRMSP